MKMTINKLIPFTAYICLYAVMLMLLVTGQPQQSTPYIYFFSNIHEVYKMVLETNRLKNDERRMQTKVSFHGRK